MRVPPTIVLLAAALWISTAGAETIPGVTNTTLVRGTVNSFDGKTLVVKTDAGALVSLPTTPMAHYAVVLKHSFSQIKPDDYLGVTAVNGAGGHLRAEEIHTIPLPGLGEGQYPWNHHPGAAPAAAPAIMTTGTVTSTDGAAQMTLRYRGASAVNGKCAGLAAPDSPGCTGSAIIDVPPATPVVAIVPGLRSDVKPGLAVVAGVFTDASGHQSLSSATLEKDGVKPEF